MKRICALLALMLLLTHCPTRVTAEEAAPTQTIPPAQEERTESTETASSAETTAPTLTDNGLELGGSSVHYPVLSGLADEAVQQAVNEKLLAAGKIENRLTRMAVLMSSPVKVSVHYSAVLQGEVLSVAILSSGALETERSTQEWAAVNVDLRTGEDITLEMLFTDAEAAQEAIQDLIADDILPEISAHLGAAELLPMPEVFSLSEYGLTLHYPIRRFETLSEQAGTITILWSELEAQLDTSPDGILARLGALKHLQLADDARERLTAAIDGGFPSIPATLGEDVQMLLTQYPLMNDPDVAGNQRMLSLEDGAFRGAYLLTDDLQKGFEGSVVQGIRADRLMLLGLVTGKTTCEQWRQALGDPEHSVTMSQETAELRRLVAGEMDYYALWPDATLCLHADEEGVLVTVMLIQAENGISAFEGN